MNHVKLVFAHAELARADAYIFGRGFQHILVGLLQSHLCLLLSAFDACIERCYMMP